MRSCITRPGHASKRAPTLSCQKQATMQGASVDTMSDAMRRRQEAETRYIKRSHVVLLGDSPHSSRLSLCRARDREAARMSRQQERGGLATTGSIVPRWWEQDSTIVTLSSPSELLDLLDNADPNTLLVVSFFSEDCYSCRSLHPKLSSIAQAQAQAHRETVKFVKINGSDPIWAEFCSERLSLKTVPYFHFYKRGKRVSAMSASLSPQKLAAFRAEIEIQRSGGLW